MPYVSTHTSTSAKYVTAGRQEYRIQAVRGLFTIDRYKGGKVPEELSGHFSTYQLAEQALIKYIKSRDPRGVAIYPGCRSKTQ